MIHLNKQVCLVDLFSETSSKQWSNWASKTVHMLHLNQRAQNTDSGEQIALFKQSVCIKLFKIVTHLTKLILLDV